MSYILTIDAGTSNSRAIIFDHKGKIVSIDKVAFQSHFPNHGWIEHSPSEILESQLKCIQQVLTKSGIRADEIAAIGIANQRETTIVWDRETGEPLWNAIVWNDRRTNNECAALRDENLETIYQKTGLYLESYFSASKVAWILEKVDGAKERAKAGKLCFGTVNTWLLWHLTGKEVFATDVSNASRTLLFNIHTMQWDEELLFLFDIPKEMLPEVRSSSEVYGYTNSPVFDKPIPISAMIGDQQGALYGHSCHQKGDICCTYGTASVLMMNIGTEPIYSKSKLLTTVGWQLEGKDPVFAYEGIVYSAASVIEWLRDSLGIIKTASEVEGLAYSVPDSGGVYFVPTLSGLATPYWNSHVKGSIFGITASTNLGHIIRATIEGIAFQISEIADCMKVDAQHEIKSIKCGGGMSSNVFLMQMQADLLRSKLLRSDDQEMTAVGAAYLAGLAVKFWSSEEEIRTHWTCEREFTPKMEEKDVNFMKRNWQSSVKETIDWADNFYA